MTNNEPPLPPELESLIEKRDGRDRRRDAQTQTDSDGQQAETAAKDASGSSDSSEDASFAAWRAAANRRRGDRRDKT